MIFPQRLRGWRFIVFNAVLGAGHIIVLFSVGSYIALMPHVAGDLGGVFPSFGTWAQTLFIIALALAFPINRWLSGRFGDYRVFVAAFVASGRFFWGKAVCFPRFVSTVLQKVGKLRAQLGHGDEPPWDSYQPASGPLGTE